MSFVTIAFLSSATFLYTWVHPLYEEDPTKYTKKGKLRTRPIRIHSNEHSKYSQDPYKYTKKGSLRKSPIINDVERLAQEK